MSTTVDGALALMPARRRALFACACLRGSPLAMAEPRLRAAVEHVEARPGTSARAARGGAWHPHAAADWEALLEGAQNARREEGGWLPRHPHRRVPIDAANRAAEASVLLLADAAGNARDIARLLESGPTPGLRFAQLQHLAAAMDLTAPPDLPRRGAWANRDAVALARAAYDGQDADREWQLCRERVAILADCLEEGGAPDAALEHLRTPAAHWRGCWAIDLVTEPF